MHERTAGFIRKPPLSECSGRLKKPGAPIDSTHYQAFIQLLRTADVIWNASRLFFQPWGLGPSQFNVLNLLYGVDEGLSQTQLSQELVMHRSNITGWSTGSRNAGCWRERNAALARHSS